MSWQECVVTVIVLLCILWVIYKLVHFFRSSGKNENPCASCISDCDLKNMFEEKQRECKTKQKKGNDSKKSCC